MLLAFVPAHGLGGAKDLPLPLNLAVAAAVGALVVSFVLLGLAWRRPRYTGIARGRLLPTPLAAAVDSAWLRWCIRLGGLLFFGYAAWALIAGPDRVTNPALGVFYVLVWVGIVPISLLFGPIVRLLSPVRTLHLLLCRVSGSDPTKGLLPYPARLGYWPAALGLLGFVWQELVNPRNTYLSSLHIWLALYVGILLVGAALFGDIWFARADPFEVFATLVGKLSVWGRDATGRPVVLSPLANLERVDIRPGLVGVVAVLLGSTGFDSFKDTVRWFEITQGVQSHLLVVNTLALFGFCLLVLVTFSLASVTAWSGTSDSASRRRRLPDLYAPSVIPIIVGYFIAHYLTYFYQMGQQTMIQLSDPMLSGANLLGTADWKIHYGLSLHQTELAITKVAAIVGGHVLGAVAAHDRAVAWLPSGRQVLGQVVMMLTMVLYTTLGLFLLFSS